MPRSVRIWLAGLLLGVAAAMGAHAAVVDEQALHALLVERIDVRKWGTGIFPEDIEAQFVFAESGTGPAPSLVLNQDGQSWKAERVQEEARQ